MEQRGLSTAEAAERLQLDGPNALPTEGPRSPVRAALDLLREPMLLLLVGTVAVYLVLGSLGEALAMAGAILVVLGISFVQERKTERTLHALRNLSSPRALVVRDGAALRIPGREVVRGDVLLLKEGDRVPADATLAESTALTLDESLLTGESVAVLKQPESNVYSGTLIVAGHGTGIVTATGPATALGRIGRSLSGVQIGASPLQVEVRYIVRLLAIMGLSTCAAVVLLYGLGQGQWLQGVLAGLTMAISMVPEEFPVILTIFLALGAWRMSQRHVLTRRFPALEALGAATVLCVDKTGTLTLNRMTIAGVDVDGQFVPIDEGISTAGSVAELLTWGHLASDARPVDPIDLAFARAHEQRLPASSLVASATRAREYPLSNALLAAANGWTFSDGTRAVAAKGAPEAIAAICRLNPAETAALLARVARLASEGLRVLAVARAPIDTAFPEQLSERRFDCLGLVAFADPVRPTVPAAIRECRDAGIRVLMLTGDYPATALAVARAIDLDAGSGVVTGIELAAMDDAALATCVQHTSVFARVLPEQKLRLVRALQSNGGVVAMTGDGVNDAPALKAADIGVAMGSRGTDVAREAAALVLLDDDFASIVGAVRLGRRVYDNIRKASGYVLAIHLPIAGMSLLPPLLRWPLVLLPLHVIFMELIVDPACSIAFEMEPEEGNVMARPPRPPGHRLFDRRLVVRSLLQGLGMLGTAFAVYAWTRQAGMADGDVRALTFTTLIVTNLMLIFANRSLARTPDPTRTVTARNPALLTIALGALAALAGVLYVPPLRTLFSLTRPHISDLLVCVVAALVAFAWMKLLELGRRYIDI